MKTEMYCPCYTVSITLLYLITDSHGHIVIDIKQYLQHFKCMYVILRNAKKYVSW